MISPGPALAADGGGFTTAEELDEAVIRIYVGPKGRRLPFERAGTPYESFRVKVSARRVNGYAYLAI